MKYILTIVIAFLITSCGPAYVANQVEKDFKGDWVLESISYPDASGLFEVELFNLASVSCFENSVWEFIPNNSTGNFVLDGNNCSKTQEEFTWYVDKTTAESFNPEMLLKITTGQKARKVDQGSRIRIISLLENQMVWEENAMFKGEEITIEMTFTKI
ncbi:hypothetical protein G3567_03335 [Psychroflexus sp. YR1-1]|uniref:Uncharacterized protein n=1 Tax=Psychroflexus aurantiacus TaxID=2709310 RepID=A0A6B3R189_9FLAO|nr:lipocalin family protein [Psychroflexus aurantiacus]NEV93180.1 hypothetical protein [Psychroflexus aurantiacus]